MNSFSIKTVTGKGNKTGCKHLAVNLKRILQAATRPVRDILTWVMRSPFARETTTIYIEDSNIRFLVTRGKWVKSCGIVPLAPGVVREGLILKPLTVIAAISELFALKRL